MYKLRKNNVVKHVKSEADKKRLIEDGFVEVKCQDSNNKEQYKNVDKEVKNKKGQ